MKKGFSKSFKREINKIHLKNLVISFIAALFIMGAIALLGSHTFESFMKGYLATAACIFGGCYLLTGNAIIAGVTKLEREQSGH